MKQTPEPETRVRKGTCRMRTGYYASHPEQAKAEFVPIPAPHKYSSSVMRTADGEWVAICSWCGKYEP